MKKIYLGLLSVACVGAFATWLAADTKSVQIPVTQAQPPASNFSAGQIAEIEKLVGDYIAKHPDIVMTSIQAGMDLQQKAEIENMEKAVAENKAKIFNDPSSPVIGNPKGTQSLVAFLDPYCGYCRKFHGELTTLLSKNKDVKVIIKEIPIMGDDSVLTIKALLAAKNQGKYEQLQTAVYSSDKHLDEKQIMKAASSLGIDTKKLKADMDDKAIQTEIDQTLELAKLIGVNGTPTLIVGEKTVLPGFISAEDLNKKLEESVATDGKKEATPKL